MQHRPSSYKFASRDMPPRFCPFTDTAHRLVMNREKENAHACPVEETDRYFLAGFTGHRLCGICDHDRRGASGPVERVGASALFLRDRHFVGSASHGHHLVDGAAPTQETTLVP